MVAQQPQQILALRQPGPNLCVRVKCKSHVLLTGRRDARSGRSRYSPTASLAPALPPWLQQHPAARTAAALNAGNTRGDADVPPAGRPTGAPARGGPVRGNSLREDPLRGDLRQRAAPAGAREAAAPGPSAEEGLEGFDKGLCREHTAAWQPAQLRGAPGESGFHPPCTRCQPAGSARAEVGSGDGGGVAERVGASAGAAASGSGGGRGGGGRAGQMLGFHEPGLEFCAGGGGNSAPGSSMRSREGTLTRPLARVRARAAPGDGAATRQRRGRRKRACCCGAQEQHGRLAGLRGEPVRVG